MNPIEQIALSSPWWTGRDWEGTDRNIISALTSGINMRHIEKYLVKYPAVEIIRGPRQIGKTTEIKMIIRELIAKGMNPKSIGYLTADILSKHKELFEVLKSFSQHLNLNRIKNGVFFIDEVSSIKDWQKAVKGFIDMGLGENIQLVLTGSSSIELKRGYERMPGRRGRGNDYLFLPVSLSKFCSLTNPDKRIQEWEFKEILKSQKYFERFKEGLSMDSAFYRKCFMDYIKIGGFPRCVSDFVKYKEILSETLFINQSVLFSEFEKYKKSITTLMQIIGEIARDISTPVSFNTIMRNIELASANTVKEYVEMLGLTYLGLQIFCIDISRKKVFNKKDKKIYLIDPVVFKVLEDKFRILFPPESNMAENMTAVHLGRLFLKEWADIGILNELFYWKSSKGNEVDFIIFLDDKPFGIEVKYQNIVSKWDEMSIRKGIGRGMVITRDVFEYGEIPKIPLWAFLLLDMK